MIRTYIQKQEEEDKRFDQLKLLAKLNRFERFTIWKPPALLGRVGHFTNLLSRQWGQVYTNS